MKHVKLDICDLLKALRAISPLLVASSQCYLMQSTIQQLIEEKRVSSKRGACLVPDTEMGRNPAPHMVGGTAPGSYCDFSQTLESNLNHFFWTKLSVAIASCSCRFATQSKEAGETVGERGAAGYLAIADFGCSCAWSTIRSMRFIAQRLHELTATNDTKELIVQAFFVDLPSNDFNTLFSLLSSSSFAGSHEGLVFLPCGIPGSFYSQVLPRRYLHIGLCTLALHNLSKVPEAVQELNSPAWNESCISANSGCKLETYQEYRQQFEEDFLQFLRCRADELVSGGLLFCVMIGKPSCMEQEYIYLYHNLQVAWGQLISEGVLEKSSLDTFNLPIFVPTLDDVKLVVARCEAEFEVRELEFAEVERAPADIWKETAAADSETWGKTCTTMIRNFLGGLIEPHLGCTNFELLLERFRQIAAADDVAHRSSIIGLIVMALLRH